MTEPDLSNVDINIVEVAERARKAGWEYEWISTTRNEPSLRISVPNGRNTRKLIVGERRAILLLQFKFEEFRLLGNYGAINHSQTGYIEALVRPTGNYGSPYFIEDIPGAEAIDNPASVEATDETSIMDAEEVTNHREQLGQVLELNYYSNRQLTVRDEQHPWSLEFSPMTDRFAALYTKRSAPTRRRQTTLKMYGIDAPLHDQAVRKLEGVGGAFLFDLDLRYGISLELSLQEPPYATQEYEFKPVEQPPSLPRLLYPAQALSLYNYGRSAYEMPLLQFLAYYQVLEFFFPMYAHQEALRRIRQTITDPRFNINDDADIARILQLASANSRSGYGNEREQLKATINGCVDDTSLLNFFRSDANFFRPLTEKKTIKGIPVIDENNRGIPLLDQVAGRVYALRNRVVHAKADSGEMAVELLLPGSAEAQSMAADVALVQFLAQKTIVAGGAQLSLNRLRLVAAPERIRTWSFLRPAGFPARLSR